MAPYIGQPLADGQVTKTSIPFNKIHKSQSLGFETEQAAELNEARGIGYCRNEFYHPQLVGYSQRQQCHCASAWCLP